MNTKTLIGIIVGAIIIIVGGFVLTMDKKTAYPEYTTKSPRPIEEMQDTAAPTTTVATSTSNTPSSQTSPAADNEYTDGTYTSMGTYVSPAGKEEIDVTLTLSNDIVTAATVVGKATHPASVRWQQQFNAGYSAQVVGRPIDSISLDVINGSSLTPKGFSDALIKIKSQADISA